MLERTAAAASLEPCSLQRVLPSSPARRSLSRTRRDLHTGFWQHGAAEYELFDACQALVRGPLFGLGNLCGPARMEGAEGSRPGGLAASTFLLDFLYPRSVSSLLRRLLPVPNRREWATSSLNRPAPNLRYSSTLQKEKEQENTPVDPDSAQTIPKETYRDEDVAEDWAPDVWSPEDLDPNAAEETQESTAESLTLLLNQTMEHKHDKVWELFRRLEPEMKDKFRADVILHLAQSNRPIESWRVSELFADIDVADWTENLVVAGVKAELTLHKFPDAFSIAWTAFDRYKMVQAIDPLVAYGLSSVSPGLFLEAWETFASRFETISGAAMAFPGIAAVPGLGRKINELYSFTEQTMEVDAGRTLRDSLDALVHMISRKTLAMMEPNDAALILERGNDPKAHEEFIKLCFDNNELSRAGLMYKKYRKLSGVTIRTSIMRLMLDVFYPNNVSGMEMVRQDWCQRHERMERRAYQKFISFYARRGDVKSATKMWQDYLAAFAHARIPAEADSSTFTSLMHAYAVRGEVDKAQELFDQVKMKSSRKQVMLASNILLNAYAKARNYAGAVAAFSDMYTRDEVDHYSFGTMMGLSGSRGDLPFTLDLYEMARDLGLEPDMTMVDALVEAYCQNDRFSEAERVCVVSTKRHELKGDYATLWNTLLHHNAQRRDLTAVNRLLEKMTGLNVSYNHQTYDQLLTALVYCRQSHHAMHLLSVARKEGIFEPTHDHYVLLMSAFIHSHEPYMALKVDTMLREANFPDSSDRMSKVIEALGKWQELPMGRRAGKDGYYFLQQAYHAFKQSLGRPNRTTRDDTRAVSEQYSRMLFVLTQMREFATIKQVLWLYDTQFPKTASFETMPIRLLSNIMLADFYESKFARVKSTWDVVLHRANQIARPPSDINAQPSPSSADANPSPARISPSFRYLLTDPLKTMQRLYLAQEDADGLVKLVKDVLAAGYLLDNKNWNYHVQALARLRRWKDAFQICEQRLMPRWTGWKRVRIRQNVKNSLPLALRRLGSNPEYLRPISHTILVLAKEYISLEQMAPWSHEAAKLFKIVNADCPRLVTAITSMDRSGSDFETQIFNDGLERLERGRIREEAPMGTEQEQLRPGNEESVGSEVEGEEDLFSELAKVAVDQAVGKARSKRRSERKSGLENDSALEDVGESVGYESGWRGFEKSEESLHSDSEWEDVKEEIASPSGKK